MHRSILSPRIGFFGNRFVQVVLGPVEAHVFGTATTTPAWPTRKAVAAITALLTTSALLSACGSTSPSPVTATPADTIVIKNFAFQPSTLVVAPGVKVTVRNQDPAAHTVTAEGTTKAFDTASISAGATTTFTAPARPGSYPYICQIHQFMHGVLTVRRP